MKHLYLILSLAIILPAVVQAQDDVYYIPSKEVRQVKTESGRTVNMRTPVQEKALNYQETRDVDDYNRRGYAASDTTAYYDDVKTVESTFDDEDDDVVYPCTKLVMRFYGPRPGIIISSPYYWDICYGDVWDVYYDSWAWSCPSFVWWSYAYDPWHYNRWYYRTCWDFHWGWYDPWWSRSYWGWGRPIYWGWNRPVFNPHHIGRPMWAHRGFDRGYAPGFGHRGDRFYAGHGSRGYGFDGGRRGWSDRGAFGSRGYGHDAISSSRVDRGQSRDYGRYEGRRTGRDVEYSRAGRDQQTSRREVNVQRQQRTDNTPRHDMTPARQSRSSSPTYTPSASPSRSTSPSYGGGGGMSRGGGMSGGGMSRGGGGGGMSRGGGGGRR